MHKKRWRRDVHGGYCSGKAGLAAEEDEKGLANEEGPIAFRSM
jgi:hypothetical protein